MRFYPQAASSAFAVCGFFTVNTLPDFTLTEQEHQEIPGALAFHLIISSIRFLSRSRKARYQLSVHLG